MGVKRFLLIISVFLFCFNSSVYSQQFLNGDFDHDFDIDVNDLYCFMGQWLQYPPAGPLSADFDGVNGVNYEDLAVFSEHWNEKYNQLIISEFMASNKTSLLDGNSLSSDWIEIYNIGDTDVVGDGFYLTDDEDDLQKWPFPSEFVLAGGRYAVIFASGQDVNDFVDPQGNYHTNFKLDSSGGYLAIVRSDGEVVFEYNSYEYSAGKFGYPPQETDASYGVDIDSSLLLDAPEYAYRCIPSDNSMGQQWVDKDYVQDSNWVRSVTGIGYSDQIPVETAGDLLVDLDNSDLKYSLVQQWVNRGILGGQFNSHPELTAPSRARLNGIYSASFNGLQCMLSNFSVPLTISGDSDWSVEAWLYNPSIGVNEAVLQWANDSGEDGKAAVLSYGTNGSSGAMGHGGSTDLGYDLYLPPASQWNHVVATYQGGDDGKENIYVNGNLVSSEDNTLDIQPGSEFRLGDAENEMYYSGAVAAVRVHSGELSSQQIRNNYNKDVFYYKRIPPDSASGLSSLIFVDMSSQMKGINSSAYIRVEFDIADLGILQDSLFLKMFYDDGFIAYLNGVEVARRSAPFNATYDSAATVQRPDDEQYEPEFYDISGFSQFLEEGTNVLAIHGLNIDPNDNDFVILPMLVTKSGDKEDYSKFYYKQSTPGRANTYGIKGFVEDVKYSVERGFYSEPFVLRLGSDTQEATIRYTVDGSEPTETTGNVYTGPIAINATSFIRAFAYKDGYDSSVINTRTYIFLDEIINQPYEVAYPWPYPSTYNGQRLNYEMDPSVTTDPAYSGDMVEAMLAVPSISLVTDIDNLLNSVTGIYVNACEKGDLWERPVSVELIDPNGVREFHINAGLRMRGQASCDGSNPKHSFRLFFRSEYGAPKLEFDLFGDEGVDKFDKVDLRTEQNYSWSKDSSDIYGGQNTFIKDTFSRDIQGAMGQPYPKTRYYHLYLNGVYWGLYMTEERPDAKFAASYMEGSADDFDTIKTATATPRVNEATDGNFDAFERLFNEAVSGFSSNYDYYRVQGLNTDRTVNPAFERLVDVNNLIDYLLDTYYIGDVDGPVSEWIHTANNCFNIYNRTNPDGFKFFKHDAEHSMLSHLSEEFPSSWLPTKCYNRTGPFNVGGSLAQFNAQWLHERLSYNTEYRLKFADRVYKHCFNDGVLTPDKAEALFFKRAAQLDMAIIAESARWGDQHAYPARTKNDDWLVVLQKLQDEFFPVRTNEIIQQLRYDDLFPYLDAPQFYVNGDSQYGGYVGSSDNVVLYSNNGTIYYTTDGTDPRLTNGVVSPRAVEYSAPIDVDNSQRINARVFTSYNGQWSALCTASFSEPDVRDCLRISEIMYHPREYPVVDANTEYVELTNIGASAINLKWVEFTNGIDFRFPDIDLSPGAYVLVVKDVNVFESFYGTGYNIAGQYDGKLDNAGEKIELVDAIGNTILDFKYKDGWRDITDGLGYSLIMHPDHMADANNYSEGEYYSASKLDGGSPDLAETGPYNGDIEINEVLAHSDNLNPDWVELYNTSANPIDIGGWYLSDNDANLTKYRIADGTTINAYDYIVFYEDTHFGPVSSDPGVNAPFSLSEAGDQVCLSSGHNNELSGYRIKESFGASQREVAFGRYYKQSTDTYNFVAMSVNTPDAQNAYPKVGPVVITEIMYRPEKFEGDWDAEYIELYNPTGAIVNLYDDLGRPWKFTDGIDYQFPANATIPANGVVLIVKDATVFEGDFGVLPPNVQIFEWDGGKLNNDGERIELSMPGDYDQSGQLKYIRVDRVTYSDGKNPKDFDGVTDPWPIEADGLGESLHRINFTSYGNDPNCWVAEEPSPGYTVLLEWNVLTYDDFESGWGSYVSGGSSCDIYTAGPPYAYQGSSSVDIENDNGDESAFWYVNGVDVDTLDYTEIKVDFWFYAYGMDAGEEFWMLYYDGGEWQTIGTWAQGVDFDNGVAYNPTVYINESEHDFPADMKIKFQCNASGSADDVFIDLITVSAR